MPETKFYFIEDDHLELSADIYDLGGGLIPDLNYDVPRYITLPDITAFQEFRLTNSERLFFVFSFSFFNSPLEMRAIVKEGNQKYYISQKNGGPTINLLCSKEIVKGNRRLVIPGFIGYHPTYWDTKLERMCKSPPALKEMYRELVKRIKRRSVAVKLVNGSHAVGRHANKLLQSGGADLSLPAPAST